MITDILNFHLVPSGDFICGFANLQGLLPPKFHGYSFGISIGKRLEDEIVDKLTDGPTLEYYDHYLSINRELSLISRRIESDLNKEGFKSFAVEPTISLGSKQYEKYLKTLSYDISHKMVATRAGLGWIGKTDLFISRKFGPRLRLVTILLKNDPGIHSRPVVKSRCGECSICVDRCPAKAANGRMWDIHTHRDEFFDAFRCREKCSELAKELLSVDERICGLCVHACPIGRSSQSSLPMTVS